MVCRFFLTSLFLINLFGIAAWATEETFDIETEQTKMNLPQTSTSLAQKINVMGRVDLTAEYTPSDKGTGPAGSGRPGESSLNNNHFLFFLKVKASEKTSFMGEFADKNFFSVDYKSSELLTTSFGKILVPFGDTRFFHHFYGGVQGYSGKGVMLQNIWSSPGLNMNWNFKANSLDTFVIRGFKESNGTVSLQDAAETKTFAAGARWTASFENKYTLITSAINTDYLGHLSVLLGGFDFYTDYGAFHSELFRTIRISAGVANAWIESEPDNYQRRGDYLQLATNTWAPAEVRIRYGTYINDSRTITGKDVHNFNIGMSVPVDVMKVLFEYQWNYEAVDEYDNDVARIMVSLDF